MAEQYDFDLFTLGAGSGGVRASRIAGAYGAKVAVAEDRYLGGTCVNVGCIPKKLLVYASEFGEAFTDAVGFGWSPGNASFDWQKLIASKDREIERLNGIYERLLTTAGVKIIWGRAEIVDAHTIAIDGKRFTAKHILIATGSWPTVPSVPGAELGITSNEAFHLEQMPRRPIIVGGGYIGVEFAGIFHGLGAHVSLVHRGPIFLRGFDDDMRRTLADEMRKREIELHFGAEIARMEKESGRLIRVTLGSGEVLESDLVLWATGRMPHSRGLGLERTGMEIDAMGAIIVNEYSQSSVSNIYAIGDITNRRNLTPVAIAEGHAVADTLFGGKPRTIDYDNIPSAVFSQPPIGTVGLTEAEARARYGAIDVYKSAFKPLKHTLSGRDERAFMKLVVDQKSRRVVGAHMIGPDAGETIQGIAIALKCGATKEDFDATIGIHPTAAEEFVTMREKA
jgi:glutathione reductase (NADPH)